MTSKKYFPLDKPNYCLETLRQKIKDASVVITNDLDRCSLLMPFFGPSPYGSLELLSPRRIDRYFAEGNLKKMTDVVINASLVLYKFRDEIEKETVQKNPIDIRQKALDILNLAIQSNAFTGRRHHFRFYKNETNLDKIVNVKNYIENNECRLLENEEAKMRFYNNR